MADKEPVTSLPGASPVSAPAAATPKPVIAKPAPQGNPAFRAMGLPNWRPKLPSRNWMIFFTIVGSWTGALVYDRRQKNKAQQKWCTLVSHVGHETLPTNTLVRKVTVYLAAPPGDSLRSAREHFVEYVKPVLVAAALDWDVVEGRREGDVRAGTAERIRRLRRKHGEFAETPQEEDTAFALERLREQLGVRELVGQKGDIVIGRHTWKEYVRGLHEGWLGPIDPPKAPAPAAKPIEDVASIASDLLPSAQDIPAATESTGSPSPPPTTPDGIPEASAIEEKKPEEPTEPPKPLVPPPHNTPESYPNSSIPRSIPAEFSASIPIAFPHILGFFNTPIRMYRFLTRRHLADDVGRQTAAAVLAATRQYHQGSTPSTSNYPANDDFGDAASTRTDNAWEQQQLLLHEEAAWSKASIKRTEGEGERVWLDEMVVDPRIGARMRKFELDPREEERARRIGQGTAGIPGIPGKKVGEVKEMGEEL